MKIADQMLEDLKKWLEFYETNSADLKRIRSNFITDASRFDCDDLIKTIDEKIERIKHLIEENKNFKFRL